MTDALLDAIDRALLEPLDEREFERCALFAIGPEYPTIVPVEGGHDLGQDGIAINDNLQPIVLCSTVGADVIGNLRKNLDRYLAEGGRARLALVATTQKLSARRIRNLEDAAGERGFQLLQVFPHGYFHRYLYADAGWRQRLLGLAGDPPALTITPVSRRPSRADLPMIGRDEIRGKLAGSEGDIILYGEPGSGKTRLLSDLASDQWGRFAVDDDRGRLSDALRVFKPARVIVDDAHLRPERLETVMHLRAELGIPFHIVATGWPRWVPGLEAFLPSATQLTLEPLTRDEILEVVEGLGLRGSVELQRSVIDQALGRPGLAATLVVASLAGRSVDVWMGDAILEDVAGTIGSRLGSQEDLAALGVLSLSDDDGLLPAELASLLGKDALWVTAFLQRVASGGTIESVPGPGEDRPLRVQPTALRLALAHDTFGSDRAHLSARDIVSRMPRPEAAALPLIYSLHRGAHRLAPLVRELVAGGLIAPRVLSAYASIGPEEARAALALSPSAHTAEIAIEAADVAPEVAVPVLLALAAHDDRARNSHPEHPMRLLGDFLLRQRGPQHRRRSVGEEVRRWIADGGDPVPAVEALALVLAPGVEFVEVSPGSSHSISIWSGPVAWEALEHLVSFWDDLIDLARDFRLRANGPLLGILGDWLYPGRVMMGGATAPDSWSSQVRSVGEAVAQRLGEALADRPGQLQALRRTVISARVEIPQRVPDDFAACYPERDFIDGGYTAEKQSQLEQQWQRDATQLAERWLRVPIQQVAERLAWIEQEARDADLSYPRLSLEAVVRYARDCRQPLAALRTFAAAGVPTDLQQPLVERLFAAKRRPSASTLRNLLDDPATSEAAAWVCLHQPVSETTLKRVIELVQGWPMWRHDASAWRMRRFTFAARLALLECPNQDARRAVVVSIASEYPAGNVPPELEENWRAAVPETRSEWWLEEVLMRDEELLAGWTRAWAARAEDPDEAFESFPDRLLPAVEALPVDTRRELLREIAQRRSPLTGEVVARLVTHDPETVEIVFAQGLERFQRATLTGQLDDDWLHRAAIARRAGWTPGRIMAVQITNGGFFSYSAPESAFWETKAQELRARLEPAVNDFEKELWEAGITMCEAKRDEAIERERHEAVYGFDR